MGEAEIDFSFRDCMRRVCGRIFPDTVVVRFSEMLIGL